MLITTLFNITTPIIQAPMAGVSTPELAAAVSNAGGLGSISIGASSLEQAKRMIEETQSKTNRLFNVNVFCHPPAIRNPMVESNWIQHLTPLFHEFGAEPPRELTEIYKSFLESPEIFQLLLSTRPQVVSFHFGIPSTDHIRAFQQAGIKTMATATNVDEARLIESAGIDAIVTQGIEAGGHRGMFDPEHNDNALDTSTLLKLLVQHINIPIIAAGGIMDGAGINNALTLGAAGVQLGTAFILCPESAANQAYRIALKSDQAHTTKFTSNISGRPARGIPNRLSEYQAETNSVKPAPYPLAYDIAKTLNTIASAQGSTDFAAQWAGQGAPLAREMPAAKLIETLMTEMQSVSLSKNLPDR